MLVYLAIVIAMAWMFTRIPTAFLPDEDQGILFAQIQTPSGATAERTKAVIDEATKYLLEEETLSPRCSPSTASTSAAVARTRPSCSSSCATGTNAAPPA